MIPERSLHGSRLNLLKFSVEVGPKGSATDYDTLRNICLECERLGYNAVYLPDGVQWTDFECWTALSHIAASTEDLRLGPAVTFVTYRHPLILAKMAATLDVLSDGRLEFRLGAGGSGVLIDRVHCGIALPKPILRVEMLGEGIHVIKKLWREEKVTFKGKHFVTKDATCDPKPLQKPYPPITVSATSKRMLRIAAEHSDIWEVSESLNDYRWKVEVFKDYCKEFGRDADSIVRAFEVTVVIAKSDREAEEMAKKYQSKRVNTKGYGFNPLKNAIIGCPDHCVEKIMEYRRAGVSSFTILFIGLKELEPLRLFADYVIPAVKNM